MITMTIIEKIKPLVLGAGESGKSTVVKQMRALHGADYTDDEREGFRLSIHQNIIETMEVLCDAVLEKNPYDSITYTYVYQSLSYIILYFWHIFPLPDLSNTHTCMHMK